MPKKVAKVRRSAPMPLIESSIDEDIRHIVVLRKQAGDLSEEIDAVQARIVEAMQRAGISPGDKPYKVTDNGVTYTATLQATPRRTIDEAKLKRKVGPSIWRRITTLTLDRNKAEALVKTGEIDPVDYADCIIEKMSAPFVKVAAK